MRSGRLTKMVYRKTPIIRQPWDFGANRADYRLLSPNNTKNRLFQLFLHVIRLNNPLSCNHVEVYKILRGIGKVNEHGLFPLLGESNIEGMGLKCERTFCTSRMVRVWNKQAEEVIEMDTKDISTGTWIGKVLRDMGKWD